MRGYKNQQNLILLRKAMSNDKYTTGNGVMVYPFVYFYCFLISGSLYYFASRCVVSFQ